MSRIVTARSLFVRDAPVKTPNNVKGTLSLGDSVTVIAEPAPGSNYCEIQCTLAGKSEKGFVSQDYLRDPVGTAQEVLIAEAVTQWHRFDKGLGKEHVDPFFKFVGTMWQQIGLDLDGRDRDQPWSAAFISFVVRAAGKEVPGYDAFKFAPAHSRYIHDSIIKRGKPGTPFWGLRLNEQRPRLGDMVCRWREVPVDYDTAEHSNAFKSHCDIIVKIDSAGDKVWAIGGNVGHSVDITEYDLGPGDFLRDTNGVFALLANQL